VQHERADLLFPQVFEHLGESEHEPDAVRHQAGFAPLFALLSVRLAQGALPLLTSFFVSEEV